MGIGGSIFLLALGAILTFALDVKVGWLDLDVVGWILMAAGAVGLVLTMMLLSRRRRTVVARDPVPVLHDPGPGVIRETGPAVTHVEERAAPTDLR